MTITRMPSLAELRRLRRDALDVARYEATLETRVRAAVGGLQDVYEECVHLLGVDPLAERDAKAVA